jgi:hypothetical protein
MSVSLPVEPIARPYVHQDKIDAIKEEQLEIQASEGKRTFIAMVATLVSGIAFLVLLGVLLLVTPAMPLVFATVGVAIVFTFSSLLMMPSQGAAQQLQKLNEDIEALKKRP